MAFVLAETCAAAIRTTKRLPGLASMTTNQSQKDGARWGFGRMKLPNSMSEPATMERTGSGGHASTGADPGSSRGRTIHQIRTSETLLRCTENPRRLRGVQQIRHCPPFDASFPRRSAVPAVRSAGSGAYLVSELEQ
jgi:hypothetical protein